MKKYLLLLFTGFVFITFFGCGDDDEYTEQGVLYFTQEEVLGDYQKTHPDYNYIYYVFMDNLLYDYFEVEIDGVDKDDYTYEPRPVDGQRTVFIYTDILLKGKTLRVSYYKFPE